MFFLSTTTLSAQELIPFSQKGKYGFKDSLGNVIVTPKYEKYNPTIREGMAIVCLFKKWGAVNAKGHEVIPCKYNLLRPVSEGILVAYIGRRAFFLDKNGEPITLENFDYATDFKNGFASVLKEGKWGFLNKKGEFVVPLEYDEVIDFSDTQFKARKGEEWFFIEKFNAH